MAQYLLQEHFCESLALQMKDSNPPTLWCRVPKHFDICCFLLWSIISLCWKGVLKCLCSRDKKREGEGICPRSCGWRKLASSWDNAVVVFLVTVTKYLTRRAYWF